MSCAPAWLALNHWSKADRASWAPCMHLSNVDLACSTLRSAMARISAGISCFGVLLSAMVPPVSRVDCPCGCRKLDPHILVMQSTQDRTAEYATNGLDSALNRRILIQGKVRAQPHCSNPSITAAGDGGGVDNHVSNACPPDRPDQSLRIVPPAFPKCGRQNELLRNG